MKRIYLLAAVVLVAFAACTKPNEAKLETPKYKAYNVSLTLTDPAFAAGIEDGSIPKTIDISSGGKFLLGFRDNDAANPDTDPLYYVSGEYTVITSKVPSAGIQYNFPKYGVLEMKEGSGNNWSIGYVPPRGTSVAGNAILTNEKVSGQLSNKLCRSWRPTKIIITADGGNLSEAIAGKEFSTDLSEIFTFLKSKGIDIDPGKYAQYTLLSIDFTESGMLFINFKDFAISPFVGNFSLNESQDQNMSYDFNLSWVDNPVIPISGLGSVNISGKQLTLYTDSQATVKGKTYHIISSIICQEIDN